MAQGGLKTFRKLIGRSGFDAPIDLQDDRPVEAVNVEWWGTSFARKRNGASVNEDVTIGATGLGSMFRHLPGNDETAAELWMMQRGSGAFKRLVGDTESTPTMKDAAVLSRAQGASFNGFLALQYKTAISRGHVWDTATVRRMGIGMLTTAVFATTDATVAGSITDTRKYRARLLSKTGSAIDQRTEAGAESAAQVMASKRFTASITVGASNLPDEQESHWELEAASITNNYGTWHYIGEAAIGSSVTDNNVTLTGDVSALAGTYSLVPSCKYAIATDSRMLFAGPYETAVDGVAYGELVPKVTRVWWTPPLGDLDVGDSERIVFTTVQRNYLDVTEAVTALAEHRGVIYVFSARRIWRLVPTENAEKPYARRVFSRTIGCVSHTSIVNGTDENGNEALYFMSSHGPYRIADSLEYCGRDVQDLTIPFLAVLDNSHGVYHEDKQQVWYWIEPAIDGYIGFTPTLLKFHVEHGRRTIDQGVIGGWSVNYGESAQAYCSAMYGNTIVGSLVSRDLKPYIGSITEPTHIWKCDADGVTSDSGAPFQAYIQTRPGEWAGPQTFFTTRAPTVLAEAAVNTHLWLTLIGDWGLRSGQGDVSLSPEANETHVSRTAPDAVIDGVQYLALRIGDRYAAANAWQIDQVEISFESAGQVQT